jgi:hypothetical protein
MRPDVVFLLEPVIDDDLCLLGRGEQFGVQDFPTQRSIETLVMPIPSNGFRDK